MCVAAFVDHEVVIALDAEQSSSIIYVKTL